MIYNVYMHRCINVEARHKRNMKQNYPGSHSQVRLKILFSLNIKQNFHDLRYKEMPNILLFENPRCPANSLTRGNPDYQTMG